MLNKIKEVCRKHILSDRLSVSSDNYRIARINIYDNKSKNNAIAYITVIKFSAKFSDSNYHVIYGSNYEYNVNSFDNISGMTAISKVSDILNSAY